MPHDTLLRQLHKRWRVEANVGGTLTLRTNVSLPRAEGSRSCVQRQPTICSAASWMIAAVPSAATTGLRPGSIPTHSIDIERTLDQALTIVGAINESAISLGSPAPLIGCELRYALFRASANSVTASPPPAILRAVADGVEFRCLSFCAGCVPLLTSRPACVH